MEACRLDGRWACIRLERVHDGLLLPCVHTEAARQVERVTGRKRTYGLLPYQCLLFPYLGLIEVHMGVHSYDGNG